MERKTKYLIFKIGEEYFCVDINYALEIVKDINLQKIISSNPYLKGMTNLRNEVIMVLNTDELFRYKKNECLTFNYYIGLMLQNDSKYLLPVTDVLGIAIPDAIDDSTTDIIQQNLIKNIIKKDEKLIANINIEKLHLILSQELSIK